MKTKFKDIIDDLQKQNQGNKDSEQNLRQLEALVGANDAVQEAIVGSIGVLIDYMEQATTKTEVVNQPKPVTSVNTPDVKEVVTALKRLESVVADKEVDHSPTVSALQEIRTVLEKLPTSFPDIPKPLKAVEISNLKDAVKAISSVEKEIKSLKLDPKIDVKASDVNIDLTPLEKKIQKLIDKKDPKFPDIKIPEVDTKSLKKAVDDVKDAINGLHFPVPNYRGENIVQAIETASAAPATSSVTSVGDAVTSTTLLSANTSRKEAIITNDSSAILYVAFGETASATNYTARLIQNGYVKTDYTGQINGVWASDAGGSARITELT